jgi:hypothetical protein
MHNPTIKLHFSCLRAQTGSGATQPDCWFDLPTAYFPLQGHDRCFQCLWTAISLYIGWVHPVAHVTTNDNTWWWLGFKPKHVVIHVFNKARWNTVANEGLLYSFIVISLLVTVLTPFLARVISSTLKMEATCTSETSVYNKPTHRAISQKSAVKTSDSTESWK